MCYASSCNPRCGDCRPKRIVDATCPECGMPAEMSREQYLVVYKLLHKPSIIEKKMLERGEIAEPTCKFCGTNLTETFRGVIQPAPCTRSRIVCGFPCGRRTEPRIEGVPQCPHMVPVGKLDSSTYTTADGR